MKTEEIIEVLEDFGAGSDSGSYNKWVKRLEEAVYLEMSASLRFFTKENLEESRKSITSYVMRCYDTSAVSLVLKLVNTDYEYLILEAIERFAKNKERL
jgi:hypothetical protein